ncbi:MAG: N-acyl homoserine lactonase family protein, partial [Comamonas sp.]
LFVFDCGTLISNKPETYGLTREEVKDTNFAVTCYLIDHPQGKILFDTGLPDRFVGRPVHENVTRTGMQQIKINTLSGQLADIGYLPKDIDYLILSHRHHDHLGNANLFRDSSWLVEKVERDFMFSDAGRAQPIYWYYDQLINSKFKYIEDNHDVFGDGSVTYIRTPGHTDGHGSLKVNLKNSGPKILSGDLYHYHEELTLDRMPEKEKKTGTKESREKIQAISVSEKAELWIGHSMEFFRNVKKSPIYYD